MEPFVEFLGQYSQLRSASFRHRGVQHCPVRPSDLSSMSDPSTRGMAQSLEDGLATALDFRHLFRISDPADVSEYSIRSRFTVGWWLGFLLGIDVSGLFHSLADTIRVRSAGARSMGENEEVGILSFATTCRSIYCDNRSFA